MIDGLLAGFFIVWFGLSVANQTDLPWIRRLTAYDYCRLIPRWTFFAPNPGSDDYHLVVRHYLADSSVTGWSELVIEQTRCLRSTFWNPRRRLSKLLHDCVTWMALLSRIYPESNGRLRGSIPYSILHQLARAMPAPSQAIHRQFGIVRTTGRGDQRNLTLLVVSFVESLDHAA